MIVFSNAKINLGLRVLDKRPDGFHNISGIFYPIPLHDIIEFEESNTDEFIESGFTANCSLSQNLIFMAINLLRESYTLPNFKIFLHKQIPVGAGLGGGSSNAAATLFFLNQAYQLQLNTEHLHSLALRLGSDVPFFLQNRPAFVQGRGELLAPIDFSLKGHYVLVVFSGIHTSTKQAFDNLSRNPRHNSNSAQLNRYLFDGFNDFEPGLLEAFPELLEIKKLLISQGALYSSLSGSGSAIFGIFNFKPDIKQFRKYYFCRLLFIAD